ALVVAGFIFLTAKENRFENQELQRVQQETDAAALTRLITLREETEALKAEVDRLKTAGKVGKAPRRGPAARTQSTSVPNSPSDPSARSPEIISFDPGEAFTSVSTPDGELYIPTGSVFQGRLITPIKTSVER